MSSTTNGSCAQVNAHQGAPVRLAFVTRSLLSTGGVESNVWDFVQAVDAREFECAVVNLDGSRLWNERLTAAGVYNLAAGSSEAARAWRFATFLRRWRPDVIHLYGLRANLLGRPLGRTYRSAVVSAIVGADPGRPARQVALDRRTAALVDRWIANSEAAKEFERRRIGMPPSKIAVVHGGIDAEYFAPVQDREVKKRLLGIGASTHVVVTVANLRPMKGHEAIVRAIPGIVGSVGDTVFLFVGDDDMGGRIQAAARERGIDHRVRFLEGFLDVRPFLGAADVFVLPSTHESFPTAILEAMSMQLPVVASRVGGIPEMLTDNETGLLIEPEDIRGLTDALARLLSHAALRERLGVKARWRVLDQFTRDHMVDALKREYLSLAQRRR